MKILSVFLILVFLIAFMSLPAVCGVVSDIEVPSGETILDGVDGIANAPPSFSNLVGYSNSPPYIVNSLIMTFTGEATEALKILKCPLVASRIV